MLAEVLKDQCVGIVVAESNPLTLPFPPLQEGETMVSVKCSTNTKKTA